MILFKIKYIEDLNSENENEAYILCNGYPSDKQVLKRINMLDYCGHEMNEQDYKDFVIDLENYTKYNIKDVEQLDYIKFEPKPETN